LRPAHIRTRLCDGNNFYWNKIKVYLLFHTNSALRNLSKFLEIPAGRLQKNFDKKLSRMDEIKLKNKQKKINKKLN
jgi:hypothetical protein